jgi:hypothetical protein
VNKEPPAPPKLWALFWVAVLAPGGTHMTPDSNLGKWDPLYGRMQASDSPLLYGDPTTYLMASSFFVDVEDVEDWGCGGGGFRHFCLSRRYVGLDGSRTPFADKIVDLCDYRSTAQGVLLRHVLEHNNDWRSILTGAVQSFRKKLCVILFTPFSEQTNDIASNRMIDVPDLSFRREDIEQFFDGLTWRLLANIQTRSQYEVEHVYLVWREPTLSPPHNPTNAP